MKVNAKAICFDPCDLKSLTELMDNCTNYNEMLFGKNTKGEEVRISVFDDHIFVVTEQNNGWIRENYYYRDGSVEEIFGEKWK